MMNNKIMKRKIEFLQDFLRVLVCFPLGYLLYWLRDIYIICERGTDARDNGYHMFRYIRENHPEKTAYYIIDKKSPDYNKVAQLGPVIAYRSWKHSLLYIASKVKISSHYMGYAPGSAYYFQKVQRYFKVPGKHIFLQHGVIKDNLVQLYARQAPMDLFICGAKPEYEFIKRVFGHPEGVVCYTGLARYDKLFGHTTKQEILIMPTWRQYLSDLSSEEFVCSDYYHCWSEILQSPQMLDLLRVNNLKLIFYPHYEMQKYSDCFHFENENIVIARFAEYDVQELLINAKLLITDYSSVFFDFAYMGKPCIYYQFDKEEFYTQHYRKGYFDYAENGFGTVAVSEGELLHAIRRVIDLDYLPQAEYLKRMHDFFELHDNHNCERIYEAIEALK